MNMVFVSDITAGNDENGQQPSIVYTRETATTCEQLKTERECSLYFNLLDDSSTNAEQNNQHNKYFIEKGLIFEKFGDRCVDDQSQDHGDTGSSKNEPESAVVKPHYQVALLRDAHAQYLYTVFQEQARLRPSFTSLDSSHTWMIYWCLHGLDLLGLWPPAVSNEQPFLAQRILSTLQTCWTKCTVSLPKAVVESDPVLSLYAKELLKHPEAGDECSNYVQFENAGGFGGGPDQLPHAATTYAAIMSLCVLASSSFRSDSDNAALQYLRSIRVPIYIWFCSLYNDTNGSFRMHVDGEMDVRATYCVLAVVHVLQMIPRMGSSSSFFTQPRIADYVTTCQSVWEGGFGGEPGAEAHGGYTYCSVASLQLFLVQSSSSCWLSSSMESCAAWLAQRQMSYEGGFSGRINKLVDGCYSFWQGAATVIVQEQIKQRGIRGEVGYLVDPWCNHSCNDHRPVLFSSRLGCLFNANMLERYILLCTQDENGGLRDKPSKGRDFYHSCYCLSGLSISQHFGHYEEVKSSIQSDVFSNEHTSIHQTHPCYNIRVEHVKFCLAYFSQYSL